MSKKLAIRGHSTRGKEVIKLLEMMGGKNTYEYTDDMESLYFSIYDDAIIYGSDRSFLNDTYVFFTLEEFLEKYPFKIGDKVYTKSNAEGTIIDMFWDGIEVLYQLSSESPNTLGYFHKNELKPYKEEVNVKDNKLFGTVSKPVEIKSHTVSLKDGKVIDNSIDAAQFMQMGKTVSVIFNSENYEDEVELQLGDYEIEVRDGKTYAIKKKSVYPKTFKECRAILNYSIGCISGYKASLLASLQDLLVCRDAYWKIAGEEMGLDKPWEPDWTSGKPFYCISVIENILGKGKWCVDNKILAFPTEEMRDAFYENFKDLIESCKELL